MTRYKIQTLKSLRNEMKAVARGQRPAPVDAAKPGFNSVEAAGPISLKAAVKAKLEALIEEATVDAYGEAEQVAGFHTMFEDHFVVPFRTAVLGVEVTVEGIDLADDGCIVALCARDRTRQRIPILDLPLPTPAPKGSEWIKAYRRWALAR